MKLLLLLITVLLLFPSSYAAWQTYQNDLRNTGFSDGNGYFPAKTSNFTSELGMNFQPLADDLDSDGNNEIVMFANNSLIILNKELEILSQTRICSILGQPTLFNLDNDSMVEIIFNARQISGDYFFAYQLNNSALQQEFNITLSNDANFSGIKCLNLNGTDTCIFKDKQNYINIINIGSRNINIYNTSAYNESRHTVPAIGDIDNDGRYEAVWWFNIDDSGGYGFVVFDIDNKSLETNFNKNGIVDNIFSPFAQNYDLKGQPVLVDLNNDNNLEIAASVFYDDSCNFEVCTDWYTELYVYNSSGKKLFSVCEAGFGGCNDGSSASARWEG